MEPLHLLFMKNSSQITRLILSEAAALGLSPGQPKVLECLLQYGESNQKAIADRCEIEQATAGSILSRMERDGMIVRAQRDGNRRSLYVTLTPKGESLARQMAEIFQRVDALAAAGLSPDEQVQLQALLQTVYATVSAVGKERA